MKNLILVSFIMLQAFAAQALIADKMTCDIEVEKSSGKGGLETIRNTQSIYVIRQPMLNHPYGSDIKLTAGDASGGFNIHNKSYIFDLDYNVHYEHAVRQAGTRIEAVQRSCLSGRVKFCAKGNSDCSEGTMGCLGPLKPPFEDSSIWKPVSVIEGLPTFEESSPFWISMSMEDKYENVIVLNMVCSYQGTYQ